MKQGYLIDMDGVIYRENQLIPGAAEFVETLNAKGIPFLFLTNNSDTSKRGKTSLSISGLSSE